ncbi:TPA: ATP synthase F0 subunit B [Patescibacteria group bacterium]|uniref:ATP synthase subunit b n=1 Tax=Candidatus Gottesmanbacteria bacterium GW2011_GWA1_43_11 TaxID=1618436 RepID=A0A0G1FD31_9BACT|nr:MAG: ATP synthase subunit b [Candidatus Gottesmanbacteria bacterium GW2011_GWA1_43_11]HCS79510.1 ATP synthase F0 subunit B [Patescibacteria group bacterium]
MEALGVELPLLLTQILNFSIVLFVLTKFLYKPILKALDERRRRIEEGLAWSEKAQLEEEKMTKRKQETLREARDEARVIVENAKKDAQRLRDDIVAAGHQEVASLKVRQQKELEAQFEKMSRELAGKTVDIAAAMVQQILPDVLTSTNQHQLVTSQLAKIAKAHEVK